MISGRGAIISLDLCDFIKRKSCDYFVDKFKEGFFADKDPKELGFHSKEEIIFIVKYRTDLVTLERLMSLADGIEGVSSLDQFKHMLLDGILSHKDFYSMTLNKEIFEVMKNRGIEILSADFLVGIYDKLGMPIEQIQIGAQTKKSS